jgi:hypothetical protein
MATADTIPRKKAGQKESPRWAMPIPTPYMPKPK